MPIYYLSFVCSHSQFLLSIAFSHAAISSGYLFCFDNFFLFRCVYTLSLYCLSPIQNLLTTSWKVMDTTIIRSMNDRKPTRGLIFTSLTIGCCGMPFVCTSFNRFGRKDRAKSWSCCFSRRVAFHRPKTIDQLYYKFFSFFVSSKRKRFRTANGGFILVEWDLCIDYQADWNSQIYKYEFQLADGQNATRSLPRSDEKRVTLFAASGNSTETQNRQR